MAILSIGFVDLTGSTSWAEHVPLAEHTAALTRFEEAARSAASRSDARVVKMIGEEAMLMATDPRQVVKAVAAICATVGSDNVLAPARGAIGYGHVHARSGDYFGPLVNLVAHAVKVAQPGHLTVTAEVAATLAGSGYGLGASRQHTLRGVDHRSS